MFLCPHQESGPLQNPDPNLKSRVLLEIETRARKGTKLTEVRPARSARRFASLLGCCLLAFADTLLAQRVPQSTAVYSRSGQFIVQSAPSGAGSSFDVNSSTNYQYLRLDPSVVAVSCERIKQILCRELGAAPAWRGKVFVVLRPSRKGDEPVAIMPERFSEGWQYRVELPNPVERTWYLRAIVQVVLLEMANREAGLHSAEIPVWLNEGLTQRLLMFNSAEVLLAAPTPLGGGVAVRAIGASESRGNAVFTHEVHTNNLRQELHNRMREHPPLSFDELSWPDADQFSGEKAEAYAASAQLFLTELLTLSGGNTCLRAMLAGLPQRYNWQFAFLDAFQNWFKRPRDIEEWWMLQSMHFSGRELTETWTADESWEKLAQALNTAVQIRTDSNELPVYTEVALQTIVRDWADAQQTEALSNKQRELDLLRLWLAPELGSLALEYEKTILAFLQQRGGTAMGLLFGRRSALDRLTDETVQILDGLDARRQSMRPSKAAPLDLSL
jgi:hypothetical protein